MERFGSDDGSGMCRLQGNVSNITALGLGDSGIKAISDQREAEDRLGALTGKWVMWQVKCREDDCWRRQGQK